MVKVLATGSEGPKAKLKTACALDFSRNSLCSPSGNVHPTLPRAGEPETDRKRSGTHLSYNIVGTSWLSEGHIPTQPQAKGQTSPLNTNFEPRVELWFF